MFYQIDLHVMHTLVRINTEPITPITEHKAYKRKGDVTKGRKNKEIILKFYLKNTQI